MKGKLRLEREERMLLRTKQFEKINKNFGKNIYIYIYLRKVKTEFSTSSILKKIDKDNLKKKHVGKHCSKTKTM
jgi:hypothetical protein